MRGLGLLTLASGPVELLCQEALVDGPQDLQSQLHSILFPIVGDQQGSQFHWSGHLELASGNPGVPLLHTGVLQLELEFLKVIRYKLLQSIQQMVAKVRGHGADQENLEPAL